MCSINVFEFAMNIFKYYLVFKHLAFTTFMIKSNKAVFIWGGQTACLLVYTCPEVRCVISLSLSSLVLSAVISQTFF